MNARTLVLAAVLLTSLLVVPPTATSRPDLDVDACVGYEGCSDIDGFAIFCVKANGRWYCGQCESCGNGPFGRELA